MRVIVEPVDEAKTRTQGRGKHAGARGGSNEGEFGKLKLNRARRGAGVDDDIEPKVFHCRVKVFFDRGVETVDLIDEKNIAALEVGEDAGKISCFFDLWARSRVQGGAHGRRDDVGKSGFT